MLDVSIVIPSYNRTATVGRAIESALAQTLPAKEIIVVDDGSTDGTTDVVERYRGVDQRVLLMQQANAGAGAARNKGIGASTGDWIGLLDSDDAWHPDKLLHAAALLEASPAIELIHSNAEFIERDGTVRSWDRQTHAEMTDPLRLMGTFFMRTSSVLIKRTLLTRVGRGFPTDRATCEDFELFWRLIAASSAIGYVPSRDTSVYITSDGLTRTSAESKLIRDNIATMGDVIRWLQQRCGDHRYQAILRGRQYWELRQLIAIWLRAGALRSLLRDLRYGASELSGREAMRAFASAGWSLLRRAH